MLWVAFINKQQNLDYLYVILHIDRLNLNVKFCTIYKSIMCSAVVSYLCGSPNVSGIMLILFAFFCIFFMLSLSGRNSTPTETGIFAIEAKHHWKEQEITSNLLKFKKVLEIEEHIRSCQAGMSLTHLILSLCSCIAAFLLRAGQIGTIYRSPVCHPELRCAHQLSVIMKLLGHPLERPQFNKISVPVLVSPLRCTSRCSRVTPIEGSMHGVQLSLAMSDN